jgi:hypothetical protein
MIWNKTIKKRVLAIVNKKIDDAEKEYEIGCTNLDKQCELNKASLADKLVEELTSKWV